MALFRAALVLVFVACGSVKEARPDVDGGSNPAGCSPVAVAEQLDTPYVVRGDVASDAMTRLDIYPPPSDAICGRPIVVWVHGGAWSAGDKSNQMRDKIPFFHDLGAVAVSINYRLTRKNNSVQHPDHVEDVAAAVAWVREHAVELGGDPDRIALLGHSAGAHLTALVVTNGRFLAAHGLSAVDVACVGSYDSEYTVSEIVARDPIYASVFTDDPSVWEDASPSAHVRAGSPPFQLACRGSNGRVAQCEAFAGSLRAAGGQASVIDASSLSHEEVNSAIGRASDKIMTPKVREFLAQCFR